MARTNSDKKADEAREVRAALFVAGIVDAVLEPGETPDFTLHYEGTAVPLEHTRLYLSDSGSSPQARYRLWLALKRSIAAARLPVELDLEFVTRDGCHHIPPSALHAEFTAALVQRVTSLPPHFTLDAPDLPAPLQPFLLRVTGRPCSLPGEVCGTPDVMMLSVPSHSQIANAIAHKAQRLGGKVLGAWLLIVLGTELSQPFLGIGELEAELPPTDLTGTPFERVLVVDLLSRIGYVLQNGTWRAV